MSSRFRSRNWTPRRERSEIAKFAGGVSDIPGNVGAILCRVAPKVAALERAQQELSSPAPPVVKAPEVVHPAAVAAAAAPAQAAASAPAASASAPPKPSK